MSKGKRVGFPKKRDFSHSDEKKPKLGILSENVMAYYRNVSTSLESGFDDDDDDPSMKDNFLTNVYNTLKDEGVEVSQNQTVSRILEMLFSHSKPYHMRELFCNFCSNLTIVMFDRFASHVFQSLIQHLPAVYADMNDTDGTQGRQTSNVHGSIVQLCKFTESHMRDIMVDTYASHVLRSLLEALGGVKVKEEVIRSRVSRVQSKDKSDIPMTTTYKYLPQDFEQSFKTLKDKIVHLCNFEDHLSDPSYCPVLQTVLLILHKISPQEYSNLVKTIFMKACALSNNDPANADDVSKRLPDIVQNEVGSYLVELIISLASEDQLNQLYSQIFKGNLIYFAVHPIANYVLQKFLSVLLDSVMLKEILSDITQYFEDILAVRHVGIVTKLAQACRNTQSGQRDFQKALLTAFHCQEPVERQIKIVPLVASLQTFEVFFSDEDKETGQESNTSVLKSVNIHGSLLLQQLLQFTKPKLVVSSILNLSPAELMGLCCDKCGSHVVDTFFQSSTVLDANKFAFLKKLEGLYVNIACNRNGSRCLESIWKGSAVKSRIVIAEQLSKNQDRIEGDQWGRFLYRNFALLKFSQRRKEWMEIQGASTKKQQLLNDIIQGNAKKKKRGKQFELATLNNEMGISESFTGSTKLNRTKQHDDLVVSSDVNKQRFEGEPQGKKAKLKVETESILQDEDIHDDTDKSVLKKKRKRNREKKRIVRGAQLENSQDTDISAEDETEKKKGRTEKIKEKIKNKEKKKEERRKERKKEN